MPVMIDYGVGYQAALATAYVSSTVGESAQDAGAVTTQGKCMLESLRMLAEIKSGSPTTITWFLSEDAAGQRPVSDERTDTLVATRNANFKSVILILGLAYKRTQFAPADFNLFIQWKLDAGTADCYAYLHWRTA
jgi:hypothetical protein|tara:strand:- start:8491 stop:8895 length:405 start_codon:yes stop_codon:yes gene_type:complete